MTSRYHSIVCVLFACGWLAAAPAQAANILCPDGPNAGTGGDSFPGMFDTATGMTDRAKVAQAVSDLRSRGVSSGRIVDRLVGAYCPIIASQAGLSDPQKTNLVRSFANQVISYVYSSTPTGESAIIIDVTLSPDLLDRVNDAAKANNMNRDDWVTTAIVKALPNQ